MKNCCLVTGGSRGIGRATVDLLRSSGWQVDAPSRSELDLLNPVSIGDYFADRNRATYRGFVHSAGINTPEQFDAADALRAREIWQVHVEGARRILQLIAPNLRASGGRVVLVSSLYAGVARVGRSNYSMSKAALESLTRGLAIEWANDDVLVNAVRPGYVRTDMTMQNNSAQSLDRLIELIPLGRLAEPSEVAEVIKFLMSPENSYLTGQVISLDGGLSAGAQPWNR